MKQENFTKIEKEIARNGCYLLCLCKIAEKYLQKELKEQDVLEIYLNEEEFFPILDGNPFFLTHGQNLIEFEVNFKDHGGANVKL